MYSWVLSSASIFLFPHRSPFWQQDCQFSSYDVFLQSCCQKGVLWGNRKIDAELTTQEYIMRLKDMIQATDRNCTVCMVTNPDASKEHDHMANHCPDLDFCAFQKMSGIMSRFMDLVVHVITYLRLMTAYINGSCRASPLWVSALIQIGHYLWHMPSIVMPQLVAMQRLSSISIGPLTSSMQYGFVASQLWHQRQKPCCFTVVHQDMLVPERQSCVSWGNGMYCIAVA